MAVNPQMRLFDVSTRTQVYVEGVKAWQGQQFNEVIIELRKELKQILGSIQYDTLDGLSKTALNKLIVGLRKSQYKIYNRQVSLAMSQLRDFMHSSLTVNRIVYGNLAVESDTVVEGEEETPLTEDEAITAIEEDVEDDDILPLFGWSVVTEKENNPLWLAVINNPIPANGLYLLPFLKGFSVSAQAATENAFRKAWANGDSVKTLTDELLAVTVQGRSGILQNVRTQYDAVISTAVQHVASLSNAAIMSATRGYYFWVSVLDSRTTEICRHRNGTRYRFGEGPLPPAHGRCRSHIVSAVGREPPKDETFTQWLFRQPDEVKNDIVGNTSTDNKLHFEPLTNKQFEAKVKMILKR